MDHAKAAAELAAKKEAQRQAYYAGKGKKPAPREVELLLCHHCKSNAGHTVYAAGKTPAGKTIYKIAGGCHNKPRTAPAPNRINAYDCEICGKATVTVDSDEGVTPFMIGCRTTPRCQGTARSRMYKDCQGLFPKFEWYKPTSQQLKSMSEAMREHVNNGGLDLRPIR